MYIPPLFSFHYPQKDTGYSPQAFSRIGALLCLLSFLLLAYAGYEYKSSKTNEVILEEAKEDALQKADSATKKINSELNSTSSLAEGVAKDLSSGKLKDDSMLRERLLAEMKNNSKISKFITSSLHIPLLPMPGRFMHLIS